MRNSEKSKMDREKKVSRSIKFISILFIFFGIMAIVIGIYSLYYSKGMSVEMGYFLFSPFYILCGTGLLKNKIWAYSIAEILILLAIIECLICIFYKIVPLFLTVIWIVFLLTILNFIVKKHLKKLDEQHN